MKRYEICPECGYWSTRLAAHREVCEARKRLENDAPVPPHSHVVIGDDAA